MIIPTNILNNIAITISVKRDIVQLYNMHTNKLVTQTVRW